MQTQAGDENKSTVSVLIINMAALFSELLRSALAVDGTVHIVASVTRTEALTEVLDRMRPDVALIGAHGLAQEVNACSSFLHELATLAPGVRPIIIAPSMKREDVVSFLHEGARGLVCAGGTDLSVLTKCIRCVAEGQIWASTAQLDFLLDSLSTPRAFTVTDVLGYALLSKREEQVLHLLADGMSNRELAVRLKLSEHTIKNHLFRIFDKLGVSNRMEAVLYLISQRSHHRSPAPPRAPALPQERLEQRGYRSVQRLQ